MATYEDAEAVATLVQDSGTFLDWCAGPESFLEDDDGDGLVPVLPPELSDLYAAAVEQLLADQLQRALQTLRGENEDFPLEVVYDALNAAGWDGALRDFKLQVLESSGRSAVMAVAQGGRTRGGRIRRRVFKAFTGALNAALDSLDGIPGVGAVKELKDFVEKLLER